MLHFDSDDGLATDSARARAGGDIAARCLYRRDSASRDTSRAVWDTSRGVWDAEFGILRLSQTLEARSQTPEAPSQRLEARYGTLEAPSRAPEARSQTREAPSQTLEARHGTPEAPSQTPEARYGTLEARSQTVEAPSRRVPYRPKMRGTRAGSFPGDRSRLGCSSTRPRVEPRAPMDTEWFMPSVRTAGRPPRLMRAFRRGVPFLNK